MANNKQSKVITEKEEQVLEILGSKDFFRNFYLAGGTSLALQLHHRKSIDLDFFTSKNFDSNQILEYLIEIFKKKLKVTGKAKGTLHTQLDSVKVSFLDFKYPLLEKKQKLIYGVKIAGIKDIAAMKLSAIHGRGSKKDFADIFFILKYHYSLSDVISFYQKKFKVLNEDISLLLKSLVYFEEAENDPNPLFLVNTKWNEIKNFLISESIKLSKKRFI